MFGKPDAFDSIEVGAAQKKTARGADELAMVLLKCCRAIGTHLVAAALYGGSMAFFGRVIGAFRMLGFSVVDHAGTRKGPFEAWTVQPVGANTRALR